MRVKFQMLFRGLLLLLLAAWAWSVLAGTLASTNQPAATTNQPSALVRSVERFEGYSLTFKLDEISFLREQTLLGEPRWKYLASLIYVVLASYAAKFLDLVSNVWLKKTTLNATSLGALLLAMLPGPSESWFSLCC